MGGRGGWGEAGRRGRRAHATGHSTTKSGKGHDAARLGPVGWEKPARGEENGRGWRGRQGPAHRPRWPLRPGTRWRPPHTHHRQATLTTPGLGRQASRPSPREGGKAGARELSLQTSPPTPPLLRDPRAARGTPPPPGGTVARTRAAPRVSATLPDTTPGAGHSGSLLLFRTPLPLEGTAPHHCTTRRVPLPPPMRTAPDHRVGDGDRRGRR